MAQNTTTTYRDKAVLWAMTVDYSTIYIFVRAKERLKQGSSTFLKHIFHNFNIF